MFKLKFDNFVTILKHSIFIFYLCTPNVSYAEQVELLVFINKDYDQKANGSELWPLYPGDLDLRKVRDISEPNLSKDFGLLDSNLELSMLNEFKKLKNSRAYRPIYHTSWDEEISNKEQKSLAVFTSSDLNNEWGIKGTIGFKHIQNYYLINLDVILSYNKLVNTDAVRLKEIGKTKNNEIYYFDHPVFGVLIKIMR